MVTIRKLFLICTVTICACGTTDAPMSKSELFESVVSSDKIIVDDTLRLFKRTLLSIPTASASPGFYSASELAASSGCRPAIERLLDDVLSDRSDRWRSSPADADLVMARIRPEPSPWENLQPKSLYSYSPSADWDEVRALARELPYCDLDDSSIEDLLAFPFGPLPCEYERLEELEREIALADLSYRVEVRSCRRVGDYGYVDTPAEYSFEPNYSHDMQLNRAKQKLPAFEQAGAEYVYESGELRDLAYILPRKYSTHVTLPVAFLEPFYDWWFNNKGRYEPYFEPAGLASIKFTFDIENIDQNNASSYEPELLTALAQPSTGYIYFSPAFTLAPFILCYNSGARQYAESMLRFNKLFDIGGNDWNQMTIADTEAAAESLLERDKSFRACADRQIGLSLLHEISHIQEGDAHGRSDTAEELFADCYAHVVAEQVAGIDSEASELLFGLILSSDNPNLDDEQKVLAGARKAQFQYLRSIQVFLSTLTTPQAIGSFCAAQATKHAGEVPL